MTFRTMTPGTKVAYTGKFLRESGQLVGLAGLAKFVVQECHCSGCTAKNLVAVNQPSLWTEPTEPGYDEEYTRGLIAKTGNTYLHINVANLYEIGQLDSRNVAWT